MIAPRVNFGELIGKTVGMFAAYILALFLPAGTFAWPSGWGYIALMFAFSVGLTIWLAQYDPALLAERLSGLRQPNRKAWDKVFLPILLVGFVTWLGVMGLDAVRFRWSQMSIWLQGIGAILLLLS